MKRWIFLASLIAIAATGAALYSTGKLEAAREAAVAALAPKPKAAPKPTEPPAVTVVAVTREPFTATVLVTGTIVPREEILVAPEINGQRIVEILVEEGDRVKKGDVMARLVTLNLDAQIAQNEAAQARAKAAIQQAQSAIEQAKATVAQTEAALKRAEPLKRSGYIADSTYDDRLAAARTARAQLRSAQDGLNVAEAEKAQTEAQFRELAWRRANTEVRAPANGVVSRRDAKLGALASSGGDPMFRIIEDGDVELRGEVTSHQLASIATGQPAEVEIAGVGTVTGKVRLISPEVDQATRLGHVRVSLPRNPQIRIGSFARGRITTGRSVGLSIPLSAVMYDNSKNYVLVVADGVAARRTITAGLRTGSNVEVTRGLAAGDVVVAKAGTFLRDGDRVRSILRENTRLSGVN